MWRDSRSFCRKTLAPSLGASCTNTLCRGVPADSSTTCPETELSGCFGKTEFWAASMLETSRNTSERGRGIWNWTRNLEDWFPGLELIPMS